MDKLDKIFELQQKFDEDVKKNRGLENVTKEEWLQKQSNNNIPSSQNLFTLSVRQLPPTCFSQQSLETTSHSPHHPPPESKGHHQF